jgi:hypothetical protein
MGLIIAALVAVAGLLALFHALISVTLFTCLHADPSIAAVSPEIDLLIIALCLCGAWVLGFFQPGVFAVRHLGTRFYGRRRTARGEIRTKWLVAGFPLLPIRSYCVAYPVAESYNPELEYEKPVMQPIMGYFYWPQMLRTAFISYGTIAWCLGCVWLMFMGPCI